jgi:hypothetical protein
MIVETAASRSRSERSADFGVGTQNRMTRAIADIEGPIRSQELSLFGQNLENQLIRRG